MMEAYEKYLEIIDNYLAKFFEQQKPFIFCKEGCSICCENGSYPFSKLEFDYLMKGFEKLPKDVKIKIENKINQLKEEKLNSKNKNFFHACPFLIDKKCIVYQYRALICRSYGLMYFYINKKGQKEYNLPDCIDKGLNYNMVYDKNLGVITTEKWKQTGIETEPVSYNVGLPFLLDNDLTKHLNLNFSSQNNLLDWF